MKVLSQLPQPRQLISNLKSKIRPQARRTRTRVNGRSGTRENWPPIEDWARRQQTLTAISLRRLGAGPERTDNGVWSSQAMSVLGRGSFAEFTAVRAPGKVIWCNFELARQLGFGVPPTNQLTPEFHEQLLAALSLRTVMPGEDLLGQEAITMYADKYGGDGLGPALGAGRAGFLNYGNLYVKGVGITPLFKHNDPSDFVHSHGGVELDDCLSEAVLGEVNENLFTFGSTRILAIIDQGKYVTEPSGRRRHIGLAVRAGAQLRPGHLLGKRSRASGSLLEMFISMTRATNQLVTRRDEASGAEIPDVSSTMLRVIDDHAQTGADSFRWRMIHGALSPSNMDLSGAMLDLPTQSTQPRTAPIFKLDYALSAFGTEHKERGFQLVPMYRRLLRTTDPEKRERFNLKWLNISNEMDKAYNNYLQLKLLCAAGLKAELAQRIQAEHSELTRGFVDLLLEMAALRNPGSACVARRVVEHVSVLDVFNLLGGFPRDYFADPNANHHRSILEHLRPVYKGNRFHVAKKKAAVDLFATKFLTLYKELMNACAGHKEEYYDSRQGMEASITARAAFENEPLDALYGYHLYRDLKQAIADYKSTGNAQIIHEAIEERIAASVRSVDALLAQGESRRLAGGGIELEMRTIEGISYCVRVRNHSAHPGRLHVRIPVTLDGKQYLSSVPQLGRLTRQQITALRYRFTTDGWKTSREARARLTSGEGTGLVIDFGDLSVSTSVGRLEGSFCMRAKGTRGRKVRAPLFGSYVFAIPDRQEFTRLLSPGSADGPSSAGDLIS